MLRLYITTFLSLLLLFVLLAIQQPLFASSLRLRLDVVNHDNAFASLITLPTTERIFVVESGFSSVFEDFGHLFPFFDKRIEILLIAPNIDTLFAYSVLDFVKRFDVGYVFIPLPQQDSDLLASLIQNLSEQSVPVYFINAGTAASLGEFRIEFYSSAFRLTRGTEGLLFYYRPQKGDHFSSGPFVSDITAPLLLVYDSLLSDYFSPLFLSHVDPKYVLFGSSLKSTYGYPHQNTLHKTYNKQVFLVRKYKHLIFSYNLAAHSWELH